MGAAAPYHQGSDSRCLPIASWLPRIKLSLLEGWSVHIKNHSRYYLCKLAMKPHMHLVEIIAFTLYQVITKPTKIMNSLNKNWAHF